MDNVVNLYYGGSVEEDEFRNVSFVGMQMVPLIFDERPLFSDLLGSARDELQCNSNDVDISVQGVLHYGKSGRIFRRMVPIASEAQWDKYVKTVMKNEFQCIDVVVWKLSNDPTPHGYSPPNGHSPSHGLSPESVSPPSEPPLPNREVDVEDMVVVPDAQSALNEVGSPGVRVASGTDDVVAAPQEIPLTQNHPRDNPNNDGCDLVRSSINMDPGFIASNSVVIEIEDDAEPYGTASTVDSDDDHPVAAWREEAMELLRRFCPDRDPLVHEFSSLGTCQHAYNDGRDDEMLEAPEGYLRPGPPPSNCSESEAVAVRKFSGMAGYPEDNQHALNGYDEEEGHPGRRRGRDGASGYGDAGGEDGREVGSDLSGKIFVGGIALETTEASNSEDVESEDDEEPYGTARAVHSDDDRPVGAWREEAMELIRGFCPDRDPLVHEFSSLGTCQHAYNDGRDDEMIEAPEGFLRPEPLPSNCSESEAAAAAQKFMGMAGHPEDNQHALNGYDEEEGHPGRRRGQDGASRYGDAGEEDGRVAGSDSSGNIFAGGVAEETAEASSSGYVESEDDEEPYGTARADDSNDDHPVSALSEEAMELITRFCPDHDPLVHENSSVGTCQHAYNDGRDDELLEAPEAEVKRTVPREEMTTKDGPKTRKIFIGGLPPSLTEDELKDHFSLYGKVLEHQIMFHNSTGRSRGFGFVTFESEDSVERVISEGRMHDLGGKQVEIKKFEPKKHGSAAAGYVYDGGEGAGYGGRGYGYGGNAAFGSGFGGGYDGRTVEVERTVPREEMTTKDSPKTRKIFIGGLPRSLTEDELKDHFSSYGKVVEHQIVGRNRGFGFVTFESEDSVERIISEGRLHGLGGKQVEIKAEPEKHGSDHSSNGRSSHGGGDYRSSYHSGGGGGVVSGSSGGGSGYGYGGAYQSAVAGYEYDGGAGAGYGYGRGYGYGGNAGFGSGFGGGYGGSMYGGAYGAYGGDAYGGGAYGGAPGGYGTGRYGSYGGAAGGTGGGSTGAWGSSRYHPYGK